MKNAKSKVESSRLLLGGLLEPCKCSGEEPHFDYKDVQGSKLLLHLLMSPFKIDKVHTPAGDGLCTLMNLEVIQ